MLLSILIRFCSFSFPSKSFYLDDKTKKECVDGILKRKETDIKPEMPFNEWSEAMFGKGITKIFHKPIIKTVEL